MKHYLVIGRVCYDDEDTVLSFECGGAEEAETLYRAHMHDSLMSGGATQEDVDRWEDNGEGVFINGVFESATPIRNAR